MARMRWQWWKAIIYGLLTLLLLGYIMVGCGAELGRSRTEQVAGDNAHQKSTVYYGAPWYAGLLENTVWIGGGALMVSAVGALLWRTRRGKNGCCSVETGGSPTDDCAGPTGEGDRDRD